MATDWLTVRLVSCLLCWAVLDGSRARITVSAHTQGPDRGRARRQTMSPPPHAFRLTFHTMSENSVQPSPQQQQRLNDVFEAVRGWASSTVTIREPAADPLRLNRACAGSSLYRVSSGFTVTGLREHFCISPHSCQSQTMCGPAVTVPAAHLDKCLVCVVVDINMRCEADPTNMSPDSAGLANTDLVVYVVLNCSLVPPGQLAAGSSCLRYGNTDRPNAGWLAVCPQRWSLDTSALASQMSEVQREVTRILGVSSREFPYWRDQSNMPLTTRDTQNGNAPIGTGPGGVGVTTLRPVVDVLPSGEQIQRYRLLTPAVRAEARRHFGCPTLDGMPMEDFANRSDLFEMRVAGQNELLTARPFLPSSRLVPVVSRLTLAALQDTGWYTVDYGKAFALQHGSGRGCSFVLDSCLDYVNASVPNASLLSRPLVKATTYDTFSVATAQWLASAQPTASASLPFCNAVRTPVQFVRCSPARRTITACNLLQTGATAPRAYFQNSSVSSVDPVSDYCPTFSRVLTFANRTRDFPVAGQLSGFVARCDDITAAPSINWGLEQYSASSLCVDHSRPWQRIPNGESEYESQSQATSAPYYGAGCYRRECLANGSLRLWVGGRAMVCNTAGQTLDFSLTINTIQYIGGIVCPSPAEFCAPSRCPGNCSWHGDCRLVSGSSVCLCYPGYTSADCRMYISGQAVDLTSASSANPDIGPPEPKYFTATAIANITLAGLFAVAGLAGLFVTQWLMPELHMRRLRQKARRQRDIQTQQLNGAGQMEMMRVSNVSMRMHDSVEVVDSAHGASYPRQPSYIHPHPTAVYPRQAPSSSAVRRNDTHGSPLVGQGRVEALLSVESEEQVIDITEEGVANGGLADGDHLQVGPIRHQVIANSPTVV